MLSDNFMYNLYNFNLKSATTKGKTKTGYVISNCVWTGNKTEFGGFLTCTNHLLFDFLERLLLKIEKKIHTLINFQNNWWRCCSFLIFSLAQIIILITSFVLLVYCTSYPANTIASEQLNNRGAQTVRKTQTVNGQIG